MKFKSWLATLIIGSNIVLPCNNTYSLKTMKDFIDASQKCIALAHNEPKSDEDIKEAASYMPEAILQARALVELCNAKQTTLDDLISRFLLSVPKNAPNAEYLPAYTTLLKILVASKPDQVIESLKTRFLTYEQITSVLKTNSLTVADTVKHVIKTLNSLTGYVISEYNDIFISNFLWQ